MKSKFHSLNSKDLTSTFIDVKDINESGAEIMLWPTRIYIARSPQPWIPSLLNLIKSSNRIFQADWYNSDFLKWPQPEIELFKNFLRLHLRSVLNDDNLDWSWMAWINVTPDATSWHNPHIHNNANYVFVYYLDAPTYEPNLNHIKRGNNQGGAIEITDPRGAAPYMYQGLEKAAGMQFRIQPEAGMLLIFPAYLLHSIAPLGIDTTRVSISGNIYSIKNK